MTAKQQSMLRLGRDARGAKQTATEQARNLAIKFVRESYRELEAIFTARIAGTDKVRISGNFDQSIRFAGFCGMKTVKVGATSTATYSSAK